MGEGVRHHFLIADFCLFLMVLIIQGWFDVLVGWFEGIFEIILRLV
jgi:hypothetical protein